MKSGIEASYFLKIILEGSNMYMQKSKTVQRGILWKVSFFLPHLCSLILFLWVKKLCFLGFQDLLYIYIYERAVSIYVYILLHANGSI